MTGLGAQAQEVGRGSRASPESGASGSFLHQPQERGKGVRIPSPMSQGKAVTQEKIQGEFSLSQGEFPGKNPGTEERREGDSLSSLDLRIEEVKKSWEPLRTTPKGDHRHKGIGKSVVHEFKTECGSSVQRGGQLRQ